MSSVFMPWGRELHRKKRRCPFVFFLHKTTVRVMINNGIKLTIAGTRFQNLKLTEFFLGFFLLILTISTFFSSLSCLFRSRLQIPLHLLLLLDFTNHEIQCFIVSSWMGMFKWMKQLNILVVWGGQDYSVPNHMDTLKCSMPSEVNRWLVVCIVFIFVYHNARNDWHLLVYRCLCTVLNFEDTNYIKSYKYILPGIENLLMATITILIILLYCQHILHNHQLKWQKPTMLLITWLLPHAENYC